MKVNFDLWVTDEVLRLCVALFGLLDDWKWFFLIVFDVLSLLVQVGQVEIADIFLEGSVLWKTGPEAGRRINFSFENLGFWFVYSPFI